MQKQIIKSILDNGMVVLVYPRAMVPKVSMQLWYRVGSKNEKMGEKGLAHFLEHMLFKGTKHLSESDINLITHKLSGYCNAFTSQDATMYLFDVPSQNWDQVLALYAECMQYARLDQQHLNSELKAVIQELKMFQDDYAGVLLENLIASIFTSHPYCYPIIGFKQDLWTLDRDALVRFYKKYYVPNNATLVVVGDVNAHEVLEKAHQIFNAIPAAHEHHKDVSYWHEELAAHRVKLYRPVENPIFICVWVVPGLAQRNDYLANVVMWLLAQGKGSRLYQKIVDERHLATDLSASLQTFFEYGLLILEFQLIHAQVATTIEEIIAQEIAKFIEQGFSAQELLRAQKKVEMECLSLFEDNQQLANAIGETFLATGDEHYIMTYLDHHSADLGHDSKNFLSRFLRRTVMHTGLLMPISEAEQIHFDQLQAATNAMDAHILAAKERHTPVESGILAHQISSKTPVAFSYPRAQQTQLNNGLTVLYCHDASLPTIEIVLDFKAKYFYEPATLQGLGRCTSLLLLEGTKHMTGYEFALQLESYGMSLHIDPGYISLSLLKDDLPQGLEFLRMILMDALCDAQSLMKIKNQMRTDLDAFWDEPTEFVQQLAHEQVYKHHPYSKNFLGTWETLEAISHQDVVSWYRTMLVPGGATLAIAGDIQGYVIPELVEHTLGAWRGDCPASLAFPPLHPLHAGEVTRCIPRDQVVICFVGLSVARMHEDFDKLILFEQIFSGGVLNSMSSRLFMLREETGLFYGISGSLVTHADEQPGMVTITTMVSQDRVQEAIIRIKQVIDEAIDTITPQEFEQAKDALINSLSDGFATHQQTALSFLFQHRYGLPADYFSTRASVFAAITMADMVSVVKRVLVSDKLVCIKIGRI
jgi:zinc protease